MTAHTASGLTGLLVAATVAFASGPTGAQEPATAEPASDTPVVYTAEVEHIIHPVSAEFMVQTMDAADAAGADLVVFTLRTPGGLLDSTRTIVTRMLASETPVAVFVGPAGARAASAGFIITLAADIAAMAPGTHIGAAHPVQVGGGGGEEAVDETMAQKAAEDVAAWVRTLANGRERNIDLAEEAVNESRAFTEEEALNASPPLIDLLADDLPDLIRKLDGWEVRRFDGTTATLTTAGAVTEPVEMSQRQRILSAIAHPEIAFILLSLGVLGLTIELWNPGAILPGIVGGVSLLLAFFALQVLPVNYVGLLLLMLGLGLLALEIKVTSYGLLTVGGVISLVLGSMMLIDSPVPEMRLSLGFVLPIILGMVAIAAFLVRLAIRAQMRSDASGSKAMVGLPAEVLTAIEPGRVGQVRVQGEIWRATAEDTVAEGAAVRVTKVDGLTLTVRKA
jgi:membrane-bound serine protease (ClpP class)